MHITQTFYDQLSPQYDRLFQDWETAVREQAALLDGLFRADGFGPDARILDCACGIGTQAIGLASLGYAVTGSDFSAGALSEAKLRAEEHGVSLRLERADFRNLERVFSERFDIVIAIDNALPHMLSAEDLKTAVESMTRRLRPGGLFLASIRDYDALLGTRPPYSPPYIHSTETGQRVSFQTWRWEGERYHLVQYLIEDEAALQISKFECDYRAVRREELTALLRAAGCGEVTWRFPEETGFYQPIVAARVSF